MPVLGRHTFFKSNVVPNPPALPIRIGLGKLSLDVGWEDHPSATLEYEGILESDLSQYERAYNPRRSTRINIYGIPFRVVPDGGYGYDRVDYIYRDRLRIEVFKVTIRLEGWWRQGCEKSVNIARIYDTRTKTISLSALARAAKVAYSGPNRKIEVESADAEMSLGSVLQEISRIEGCYLSYSGSSVAMKPLSAGDRWNFAIPEIIQDGTNTLGVPPYYNDAELTFGNQNENPEDESTSEPEVRFQQQEPKVETTTEDDDDVRVPPKNSKVLRDLSSNFDKSGPKKVKKTSTTIDGKPDREITEIWGFVYTLKDGDNPEGDFIIAQPSRVWQMVEYEERQYIYYPVVGTQFFTIKSSDRNNPSFRLAIHPDYVERVKVSLGANNTIGIESSAEYLVEIQTTGWKLSRPSDEPAEDQSTTLDGPLPDGSAFYEHMLFRRLPRHDRTRYYLRSARSDYGDRNSSTPFEIEWTDWQLLSPEMQKKINLTGKGNLQLAPGESNPRVGLIRPDLNWVESMLTWAESRQSSSFALFPHPENEPPDNYRQPLICGEEGYYQDLWQKIDDDRCKQKIVEFNAQDAGFSTLDELVKYKRIIGQPSEASYRQRKWEEVNAEDEGNRKALASKQRKLQKRYFAYSDEIPPGAGSTGGLSFQYAKNLREAKRAAETQLIVEGIQGGTQKSATISWYFPQIRDGDYCRFEADRFARYGSWRVTSASLSLEFDESEQKFGAYCRCAEGTQISCGMQEGRSVFVTTKEEPVGDPDAGDQGKDPAIEQVKRGDVVAMGGTLPAAPGRRM